MKDKGLRILVCFVLTVLIVGAGGCPVATVLQDASAVQLEASLISMMDSLLRTLVYNAIDLTTMTATGYRGL